MKICENDQFSSFNSFLVSKHLFKRLEFAFWRKIEKVPKNAEKSNIRDVTSLMAYISMVFGLILKPFMVDEVHVIYF